MSIVRSLVLRINDEAKKWAKNKLHNHKCSTCDEIWSHGEEHQDSRRAHRCPGCGTYEWWIHQHKVRAKKAFIVAKRGNPKKQPIPNRDWQTGKFRSA